ncbi:MAG: type II toxin-antitoxin system YafQ family toxin [Anaerolineaceae bacterium]|nr:type II toxin-antitoxin system YafQ family toxin [Anaerolineaceae bacterium]
MSLTIRQSIRFRRDVKRLKRQGADLAKLQTVIRQLVAQDPLADAYRDDALIGNWKGFRECHIQPYWLLIYRVEENELQLARTGSHADLFK